MRKSILLGTLILSGSLFASKSIFDINNYQIISEKKEQKLEYVIGISGGLGNANIQLTENNGVTKTNESNKENYEYLNLRLGKISTFKTHEFRTTLNIATFNTNKQIDEMKKYSLDLDYALTNKPYDKIRPFIGMSLYYLNYDLKDGNNQNNTGLGLQAGVNYFLDKQFNLEAGYKFNFINSKIETTNGGTTQTVEMEDLNQLYIGLNYRF